MNQRQYENSSHETQLMHNVGDAMTGGKHSILLAFARALMRANFMLIAVFLRVRIGKKLFNYGLWFWSGAWILILSIIAEFNWQDLKYTGVAEGWHDSARMIFIHGQLFFFLMVAKWIIAVFSLGSSNPRWFREETSMGESLVYSLIRRLLLPLKLIDDEVLPRSSFLLNEGRYLKYWEPLILFITGYQLRAHGYYAYGWFLMIATSCYAIETFKACQNTARMRQAKIEAQHIGKYIQTDEKGRDGKPYVIR